MEFPIFQTTALGNPQLAELHDFRILHPDQLAACQAALLEAGIVKFGFPDGTGDGFVLVGDGAPSMQALITSTGGAVVMGAAALYNVVVTAQVGNVVDVQGELLVASTPEVVSAVLAGVVGFETAAQDPDDPVQTVRVVLVSS